MQFPESWLREFCNPPLNTRQLADLLTMSGLEVEELRPVAPPFSGVVVAEIVEAVPHPQADRLRVCQVERRRAFGEGRCRSSAARRMRASGIKAPLALVGAELPRRRRRQAVPDRRRQAARRREPRHAVLGARTEVRPTTTAACSNWPPTRRWAPTCARAAARRHRLHAQAHAQPGACAQRLRHRARSLGADRCAAEDAGHSRR